jgi:hypothetical protein
MEKKRCCTTGTTCGVGGTSRSSAASLQRQPDPYVVTIPTKEYLVPIDDEEGDTKAVWIVEGGEKTVLFDKSRELQYNKESIHIRPRWVRDG